MFVNKVFKYYFFHCEELHFSPLLTAGDVCFEPVEVGPCRTETPRWYFNSENNRCQEFLYGGCGGNQNNFHSEDVCRTVCPGELCNVQNLCSEIRY